MCSTSRSSLQRGQCNSVPFSRSSVRFDAATTLLLSEFYYQNYSLGLIVPDSHVGRHPGLDSVVLRRKTVDCVLRVREVCLQNEVAKPILRSGIIDRTE
jgi:hypothetical protein